MDKQARWWTNPYCGVQANGEDVARIASGADHAKADAALIAAAPELFEALDRVTNQLAHKYPNDEAWEQARAALAKARGDA